MKILDIKTMQDLIDYFSPYGSHVVHVIGEHKIRLCTNLSAYNSSVGVNCKTSKGEYRYILFKIDNKDVTFDECLDLIVKYNIAYKRENRMRELGI